MAGFFQTRERRALVVFLLLAGVFVAGLLLAERRKSAVSADRVEAEMEATVAADSVRLFEFDPNTVEYADLRRLGLSSRMAVSLLKYRAAGKVFRIPEDVATCYGMTDSVYFILEPYIRIGREYALTPSPRREYREYVPQEPRRIVPRERFRIDTVSASYLASLGFSVRQAEAIVRYRDLYDGLRDEAGFRACYMIADSVADLLLPYVIFPEPEPVRSGLIELNGADSATLRSVVGIGEKSVMPIIRYRERLGGFYSVDQLAEVPQVTESNFERIVKQIYCDSFKIRKIDINFAPPSTLKGHPYLPPAVAIGVGLDFLIRLLLLQVVRRVVKQTKVTWDDIIFDDKVLRRLCHIVTPILVVVMLPIAFPDQNGLVVLITRLVQIAIVIAVLRFVNSLLEAIFQLMGRREEWKGKPLKGLMQTGQVIAFLVAVILVFSILLDRSPAMFLTGLGASAAIFMLVFRDSILGFVSGIQLSANNMLKVGDWISMPKYGADGTVEEVTLNTVKVRNWDNTIVTLPPYLLVSDSFQNWEGMRSSGGRRVKRSINIDMTSIRFCTPEMLERYKRIDLLKDYIARTQQRVEEYNRQHDIPSGEDKINGLHQTNIGVFRNYLNLYLKQNERVNHNMMVLVRQLQPTEQGLPMELYFFTDTVDWVPYEGIQADVFDHVLAVIPEFDLRVFQNPSGNDLRTLTGKTDTNH